MYSLTAIIETAQLTTRKIRNMLSLKEETERSMKQALGSSFSYDLLQLLFTLPYLKIELLEAKKNGSQINSICLAERINRRKYPEGTKNRKNHLLR